MTATAPIAALLMRYLRDTDAGWSCGAFGAIAEFARSPDEPVRFEQENGIAAVTARGAIRIAADPAPRPIAYELTSRDPELWQHGLALCLEQEACAMAERRVLTELGPDRGALRPEDRDAILFDLGLGVRQADLCVRSADPQVIARLRAGCGRKLLEPGNTLGPELAALSPHRVFCCRFGRIEVYQPIPAPGGKSPDGPHTHLLPKLLAHELTHAANLPIPAGWVPCMTLFPANPLRDGAGERRNFDAASFRAFQELWAQFGDPALVAVKRDTLTAIRSGAVFVEPETREGRMVAEVAKRQAAWHDRSAPTDHIDGRA
jgi:hypothetical protein